MYAYYDLKIILRLGFFIYIRKFIFFM